MKTLVVFDFPFPGPFGAEMAAALGDLARDIAGEAGLIWKIWTESPADGVAGGIYYFTDRASADAYIEKHTQRLQAFGISGIRAAIYAPNEPLSLITRGPIGA